MSAGPELELLDLVGYVEVAPACGDCTYCGDGSVCVKHGVPVADGGHCPAWMPAPIWLRVNPKAGAALGLQLVEFHRLADHCLDSQIPSHD